MRHLKTFEKLNLDWIKDKLGIVDKSIKYAGKDPDNIDPFKEEDWGYAERERLKKLERERIAELNRQRELERRRIAEELRLTELRLLEETNKKYKIYLESTPYQIVKVENASHTDQNNILIGKTYFIGIPGEVAKNTSSNIRDTTYRISDYYITKRYDRSKEYFTKIFIFTAYDHRNDKKIPTKDLESAFEWISKNWKNPMESEEIKEVDRKIEELRKKERMRRKVEEEERRLRDIKTQEFIKARDKERRAERMKNTKVVFPENPIKPYWKGDDYNF